MVMCCASRLTPPLMEVTELEEEPSFVTVSASMAMRDNLTNVDYSTRDVSFASRMEQAASHSPCDDDGDPVTTISPQGEKHFKNSTFGVLTRYCWRIRVNGLTDRHALIGQTFQVSLGHEPLT